LTHAHAVDTGDEATLYDNPNMTKLNINLNHGSIEALCQLNISLPLARRLFAYRAVQRYCQKTTTVKGVTIPEGAVVIFPVHWLHHSPLYWKDPEMFNPDRCV
jgi:hypothetical protein